MAKPVGKELPKLDRKPRLESEIRLDLIIQVREMFIRWEMWKCQT
jgi:hypothetical protein